jgi:hypothetical protein
MMGESIFAEIEFGHGACFTIRVPAVLRIDAARSGQDQKTATPIGAAA